jgi:predicted permease
VPFSAVLGYLFGGPGAIPIAMASLVVNLTAIPVTILFLTLDSAGEDSQGKCPVKDGEHLPSPPEPCGSVLAPKLAETVKQPIVWVPVLAFGIVLSGASIPQLIGHSLSLLGHASGGVALFGSGIGGVPGLLPTFGIPAFSADCRSADFSALGPQAA